MCVYCVIWYSNSKFASEGKPTRHPVFCMYWNVAIGFTLKVGLALHFVDLGLHAIQDLTVLASKKYNLMIVS